VAPFPNENRVEESSRRRRIFLRFPSRSEARSANTLLTGTRRAIYGCLEDRDLHDGRLEIDNDGIAIDTA
jgi:hypothetical protein